MEKTYALDQHETGSRRTSDKDPADFEKAHMTQSDWAHVEHAREVNNDSIEEISSGWFIWLVALTASIAGFLFGYDTGIISGVLVVLDNSLNNKPVTDNEKEAITSLCSAGAFIGAIIAGMTADKFGRKAAIYAGCFLFTIGAILQASAFTIAQMCIGRLIVGFGVGSAAMLVPLYIAELAPMRVRGRMIGLNNMSITGGQVVSYGIGAGFENVTHGWRYMVGLGAVPAIILACLLPFCPESPRQLVYHNKSEQAREVIFKIYKGASDEQVQTKLHLIQFACDEAKALMETGSTWSKVKKLHTVPSYFRALLCACGLMVISQMSGFNTLMYYSSTLFSLVGFSNSTAVSLVVAGTNFIMTLVNMWCVDPLGRRRVLLSTVWGMSAGLIAVAVAFQFIPVDLHTLALKVEGVTPPAIVVLVFIVWFVFFYGVSVGNTAWMSTDFFPMEVRAIGTMWLTCSCWGSNLIVSSSFLSMMKSMTPSGAFGFYAAICGIGWILIYFFYPEVSGLTLEEIGEVFKNDFGIKYARDLRKEKGQIIKERIKERKKAGIVAAGH